MTPEGSVSLELKIQAEATPKSKAGKVSHYSQAQKRSLDELRLLNERAKQNLKGVLPILSATPRSSVKPGVSPEVSEVKESVDQSSQADMGMSVLTRNKTTLPHITKQMSMAIKDFPKPVFLGRLFNIFSTTHEFQRLLMLKRLELEDKISRCGDEICLIRQDVLQQCLTEFMRLHPPFQSTNKKEGRCFEALLSHPKSVFKIWLEIHLKVQETCQKIVPEQLQGKDLPNKLAFEQIVSAFLAGSKDGVDSLRVLEGLKAFYQKYKFKLISPDVNPHELKRILKLVEYIQRCDKQIKLIDIINGNFKDICLFVMSRYRELYYNQRTADHEFEGKGKDFNVFQFLLHHLVSGLCEEYSLDYGTITKEIDGERHLEKAIKAALIFNKNLIKISGAIPEEFITVLQEGNSDCFFVNLSIGYSVQKQREIAARDREIAAELRRARLCFEDLQADITVHLNMFMLTASFRTERDASLRHGDDAAKAKLASEITKVIQYVVAKIKGSFADRKKREELLLRQKNEMAALEREFKAKIDEAEGRKNKTLAQLDEKNNAEMQALLQSQAIELEAFDASLKSSKSSESVQAQERRNFVSAQCAFRGEKSKKQDGIRKTVSKPFDMEIKDLNEKRETEIKEMLERHKEQLKRVPEFQFPSELTEYLHEQFYPLYYQALLAGIYLDQYKDFFNNHKKDFGTPGSKVRYVEIDIIKQATVAYRRAIEFFTTIKDINNFNRKSYHPGNKEPLEPECERDSKLLAERNYLLNPDTLPMDVNLMMSHGFFGLVKAVEKDIAVLQKFNAAYSAFCKSLKRHAKPDLQHPLILGEHFYEKNVRFVKYYYQRFYRDHIFTPGLLTPKLMCWFRALLQESDRLSRPSVSLQDKESKALRESIVSVGEDPELSNKIKMNVLEMIFQTVRIRDLIMQYLLPVHRGILPRIELDDECLSLEQSQFEAERQGDEDADSLYQGTGYSPVGTPGHVHPLDAEPYCSVAAAVLDQISECSVLFQSEVCLEKKGNKDLPQELLLTRTKTFLPHYAKFSREVVVCRGVDGALAERAQDRHEMQNPFGKVMQELTRPKLPAPRAAQCQRFL